jgi:hypothetical protein
MLKIRKRKKMKTQRLITIVAVVAIVLSLSVVGISAAGTSIAKPTSQVLKKVNIAKLPTVNKVNSNVNTQSQTTVNKVNSNVNTQSQVSNANPTSVQDPNQVQVVHNVVTPVVNLYHTPTPPPFPTPTPNEPIFTWFGSFFNWLGSLFHWIFGFL